MPKKPYIRESQLEVQVCHYMALKRLMFWKQPQRGYFDVKQGRFRADVNPYVRKGVPDIIWVHEGMFIGLELKSHKGKQSPHQLEFERDLKAAGGRYYVIQSFEQAMEVIDRVIMGPGNS